MKIQSIPVMRPIKFGASASAISDTTRELGERIQQRRLEDARERGLIPGPEDHSADIGRFVPGSPQRLTAAQSAAATAAVAADADLQALRDLMNGPVPATR